jgi:polysaccharide export outer membrane protein
MIKVSALAALVLCGICCWPQQDSLLIGPGDQVQVQVLEAPELQQTGRVTDDGTIPLLLGGNVKIAGMPPSGAASAIEHALIAGGYVLHPHVNVTVVRFATQDVSVMGQVHSPGSYFIGTPRTVVDVLALAGGVTELADRKITIERHATKEKVDYFLSNKASEALAGNVGVYPGDIVFVPKVDVVYVLGDVYRPGGFPMSTNDSKLTVLEVISLAGSTQPSAVPSHAKLIRKQPDGTYVEIHLPLSDMQKGKRTDMALAPDDIIYVPYSYIRNMGSGLTSLVAAASTATIYRY